MALTLTEIRQSIRDLPGCREEEAIGILETLLTRFPKKSVVADTLLDAIMVIEAEIMEPDETYQSEPRGEYDAQTVRHVGGYV